jgi:homoserine kinase type II
MQSELADRRLTAEIETLFAAHWDRGPLIRLWEIGGGYCNRSFGLHALKGKRERKFLLRRYNPKVIESEIRFEHALISHLRRNGFHLAAAVIPCPDGATYARTTSPETAGGGPVFWALFDFLEGQDKYTWMDVDLNEREFVSCADILARLHHAGRGFVKPPGADRAQPRIMALMETFKGAFAALAAAADERVCDRLLRDNLQRITAVIDRCLTAEKRFHGMPELPIHCDFHPGNLKYGHDRGIGLFDFDWAKVDYRLFDVALALVYFCAVWTGDAAGTLLPQKMARFLAVYNDRCSALNGIEPLTAQEKRMLRRMLAAANLFVLNWDLTDFYQLEDPDDVEYATYIRHNLMLLEWIETQSELSRAIDG